LDGVAKNIEDIIGLDMVGYELVFQLDISGKKEYTT